MSKISEKWSPLYWAEKIIGWKLLRQVYLYMSLQKLFPNKYVGEEYADKANEALMA
ncbi:hypothetical protein [Lederbergia lenta]|uniref:hypothetical protein n=1 Tax=Lederbergia lenta TaxID=1467 RepID=UPI000A6F1A6C|nr:hypothetical protein [Lederbergia lenta]MCM3110417.1 hypothetical protein [Lederbergia lenta]MEC2324016.1 hypothetical protein [Lederbergia lenta]